MTDRGKGIIVVAFAILIAGLAVRQFSYAIPNVGLNPHPHANPDRVDGDTTWIGPGDEDAADPDPDDPDSRQHQHRDRHDPTGNDLYEALDVWDDRIYRRATVDSPEVVHGFINVVPRFAYSADPSKRLPPGAQRDFEAAIQEWIERVNGIEFNVNGKPIRIRIGLEKVEPGEDHEIDVVWEAAAGVTSNGGWNRDTRSMDFNPDPKQPFSVPGHTVRIRGSNDPFVANLNLDTDWTFGTGLQGMRNYELECRNNQTGVVTQDCQQRIMDLHFRTIARHELGHLFGLDHHGGGIMREDIEEFRLEIDDGSVDGVKDLYSIPVPGLKPSFGDPPDIFWNDTRPDDVSDLRDETPIRLTFPPGRTVRFEWTRGEFDESTGDAKQHPDYGVFDHAFVADDAEVCFHRPDDETVTDWKVVVTDFLGRAEIRGGNIRRDSPWRFSPLGNARIRFNIPILAPRRKEYGASIYTAIDVNRASVSVKSQKSAVEMPLRVHGGRIEGLPGVYFATSPFTFDPESETGWVPIAGESAWLDSAEFAKFYGPIDVIGMMNAGEGCGGSGSEDRRRGAR